MQGCPSGLGAGLQNQLERFDSVTLLYFEFNKKKPYSNTSMPCKPQVMGSSPIGGYVHFSSIGQSNVLKMVSVPTSIVNSIMWVFSPRSSAWLEHDTFNIGVLGSNPSGVTRCFHNTSFSTTVRGHTAKSDTTIIKFNDCLRSNPVRVQARLEQDA